MADNALAIGVQPAIKQPWPVNLRRSRLEIIVRILAKRRDNFSKSNFSKLLYFSHIHAVSGWKALRSGLLVKGTIFGGGHAGLLPKCRRKRLAG